MVISPTWDLINVTVKSFVCLREKNDKYGPDIRLLDHYPVPVRSISIEFYVELYQIYGNRVIQWWGVRSNPKIGNKRYWSLLSSEFTHYTMPNRLNIYIHIYRYKIYIYTYIMRFWLILNWSVKSFLVFCMSNRILGGVWKRIWQKMFLFLIFFCHALRKVWNT